MAIKLPQPRLARPLPPCDPFRHRTAYIRMLAYLYHAEAAALAGFELLTDPRYVEKSDLFDKAAPRLVADEARHLEDVRWMLARLGAAEIPPPTAAERELWEGWKRGDLFALPYKASIASLFCLFSEGLGYAFLHHLHAVTLDPEIKARLASNLDDEQMHLRLSISVLQRALARDHDFVADFLVYFSGYALLARQPLREIRGTLNELGLDFELVVASSLRFVYELFELALERAGQRGKIWTVADRLTRFVAGRPATIRLVHAAMYLPEPPLARRLVHRWGLRRQAARVGLGGRA
jgi:hypothetical protein